MGFNVPENMKIDIFAKNLPGARVIVRDGFGNFWVSRPDAGVITQLEVGSGGTVTHQSDIFRNLDRPHGLAVDPAGLTLYFAEETTIKKAILYSDADVETIAELPPGGRHWTRTIAWGPDDRLYVSIGSTCDACVEKDEEHASIISMNPDSSDRTIVASGLRNAVFFDWSYVTGKMFATEMGRDNIGDTNPPDEVNIIDAGLTYGWPYCFGNRIRDTQVSGTFDCTTTVSPHIELPAHVAPLGLAFIPEEGWPEEWWYDLLIAEHGSWNSTEKVGYKIVRIPLDAEGGIEGEPVDFVTGFLQGESVVGRPVDLMIDPGGTLFVSDDKAGVIYKMSMTEPPR
jgi:glucose/arabinose dehydrogenase